MICAYIYICMYTCMYKDAYIFIYIDICTCRLYVYVHM